MPCKNFERAKWKLENHLYTLPTASLPLGWGSRHKMRDLPSIFPGKSCAVSLFPPRREFAPRVYFMSGDRAFNGNAWKTFARFPAVGRH